MFQNHKERKNEREREREGGRKEGRKEGREEGGREGGRKERAVSEEVRKGRGQQITHHGERYGQL